MYVIMQRKYIYIRFIGSEISWPVSFPIFQIFQLPWQLYTYIWWAEGGCLELVGNQSHINKVFHKAFNKVVYKVFYNSSWQMWCHGSFVLLRCWFSFFYFDFRIPSTVHTKSSCGLLHLVTIYGHFCFTCCTVASKMPPFLQTILGLYKHLNKVAKS